MGEVSAYQKALKAFGIVYYVFAVLFLLLAVMMGMGASALDAAGISVGLGAALDAVGVPDSVVMIALVVVCVIEAVLLIIQGVMCSRAGKDASKVKATYYFLLVLGILSCIASIMSLIQGTSSSTDIVSLVDIAALVCAYKVYQTQKA